MEILVLVAGTNETSNSNMLADTFVEGMQQHATVTVHKRKLKDLSIDHFTVDDYDPHCNQEEDFCEIQHLMQQSSGVVIASPIWNFSVPAHLKNLIDRMGSFALDASRSKGTLKGLPFFCIFTGGAPLPAWKGMMQLTSSHIPEALKYFGASYIGHHFEGKCTQGVGTFGLVVDQRPKSLERVREKGHAFASVVEIYAKTGKAPLKNRAQGRLMRWGKILLDKF